MLQQLSPSTPSEVSLSVKRKLIKQSTREHMKLFVTVYHSLKEATSHGIVSPQDHKSKASKFNWSRFSRSGSRRAQ